ncbi:MAG: hypothetical protein CVU39_00665 [Chloroflexi bacterium HGW-Chloroflexi-10]|nr:MAG: hypothetical protein CVU39_00665 [Chloroflexi bacterium HGW-Chloroflexi-10]
MTKLFRIVFLWIVFFALVMIPHKAVNASPLLDGTTHTGTLASNETWTMAGNPHTIDGSLTIPNGISLTIEPGVVVRLVNNYSYGQTGRLVISGILNAIGTDADNIVFTSGGDSAPTQWGGLIVSGGTANLAYAEVRYGGIGFSCSNSPYAPVCVQNTGTLSLDHMYFHHNSPAENTAWSGVVSAYSANDTEIINLSIKNSRFEDNGTSNTASGYYPVFLDGAGVRLEIDGNIFTNNQKNRVLLQNDPMKTQTSTLLTSQEGLEAYEIGSFYTIHGPNTLTIEPGVRLLTHPGSWGSGYAIFVEGTLIAEGTEADPIVMDASDPVYGWGGLIIQGADASATLDHIEIWHGGRAGGTNQRYCNVAAIDGGQLFMSHSLVADNILESSNYQNGVIYLSNGSATLTDNTISNTMLNDVKLYSIYVAGPDSVLDMTNNTFSGNSINAVLLGTDGLSGTHNSLRPQPGLAGYDFGVPYSSDIYTLLPSGTLNLEPGTIMRGVYGPWGKGIVFKVQGQLNAIGTPTEPVVFQAVEDSAPAAWGGIYVSSGSANLAAITIRNAGRGQGYPIFGTYPSLWVDAGGSLLVNSALITNNQTVNDVDTTVRVDNAYASIRNSVFSGNGNPDEYDYPISISGADSRVTLAGNRFDVNGYKRIVLSNNALTGADFSLPMVEGLEGYELASKFTIPVGITMTVEPGVNIMGRMGSGLMVNGRLEAQAKTGKDIVFTSTSDNGPNQWSGVIFNGSAASGYLDGVAIRCGGSSMAGYSEPLGSLIFNNLSPNAVHVLRSKIESSGTAGWQIFNSNFSQNNLLDGNRLISNPGVGLRISGTSQVILTNTAFVRNTGGGIYLAQSGVQATLLQTTLVENGSYGVRAVSGTTTGLTNTILSKNTVGVLAESGSSVTLNSTLWDSNTTPSTGGGTLVNNSPYTGAAALEPADGYHLTLYSQALGKGQNAGIITDIDGRSRPQPTASSPDLGADEFNQAAATEMTAEKLALSPVWINLPDPDGNPFGELLQRYWVRFLYGSDDLADQPIHVSVVDTLPTGLDFESEIHSPDMSFTHIGQTLEWETEQTVAPQQTLDIQIDTSDSDPIAGHTYTNIATLIAGNRNFNLSVETQVPLFAPLITWPVSGEICPTETTSLEVKGSAQPGTTIEIYEGSVYKGQSITNSQGLFTVYYTGSIAGNADLFLNARACKDGTCSELSSVELFPSQSFWCPQRSAWTGTPAGGPLAGQNLAFDFRDQNGYASTQEWYIEGVLGFSNTQLDIHACSCPPETGTTDRPTNLWVVADGVTYAASSGSIYPDYHFDITGSAHSIEFWAQCEYEDEDEEIIIKKINDRGHILIDPDGYVFDSTLGFDASDPTAHVLPGSTVTCMANIPEWGGWVPWPAHLYNNQVNPQVVSNDGYFAFFTPPGEYYLQVEPPAGYQPWRSPVVEVVNEIVHVNVPLTPIYTDSTITVQTGLSGFSQPNLVVPVGSVVKWLAVQGGQEEMSDLVNAGIDPILQVISSPDPFASTLGWDSGRLVPSESYQYRFNVPGIYTYTDSAGHTAVIRVGDNPAGNMIFLPILVR